MTTTTTFEISAEVEVEDKAIDIPYKDGIADRLNVYFEDRWLFVVAIPGHTQVIVILRRYKS